MSEGEVEDRGSLWIRRAWWRWPVLLGIVLVVVASLLEPLLLVAIGLLGLVCYMARSALRSWRVGRSDSESPSRSR